MPDSVVSRAELGFAEFVALLITETLEAVVNSLLEQEKRATQLEQSLRQTPKEVGKQLTEDEVRAEIVRLFPDAKGREGKSAIDAGEPYSAASESAEENPPVLNRTGYHMEEADSEQRQGQVSFGKRGYESILGTVRTNLAFQQLDCLRTLLTKGVPRVYVDNGKISAKLTMRYGEPTEEKPKTSIFGKTKVPFMRRMFVQPVTITKPEFLTLRTDIVSEVEITFKTVVS